MDEGLIVQGAEAILAEVAPTLHAEGQPPVPSRGGALAGASCWSPVRGRGRRPRAPLERGARAVRAPAIRIAPARSRGGRALADLAAGRFAWLVLTSPRTVAMLEARMRTPTDVRAGVAAIGDGTAGAYRRWSRRDAELRPETFTTAALARAFPRGEGRVLCARADIAPPGLEDALAAKGWTPTRVDAYRTAMARSLPAEARAPARGPGRRDHVHERL
ncbi:MAG: uroporphyrinogen-III synthase [Actinomycetota bacterium]